MPDDRYEKIIHASHDFITLIDRSFRYAFVNASYAQELGLKMEEILGKTVAEIWGQDKFSEHIKARLEKCFSGEESHDIDQFRFGESVKHIHVSYYPYYENGVVTHVMVFSHDVSEIKKLESKLLDFEFRDPTTGLFNRKSFRIVLDMELEKARRATHDKARAVLFINIRNLSQINASFGYEFGDILLESTALRIKEALRSSDYVFRFEGKEFAVLLTTIRRGEDIPIVASNIHSRIHFPYNYKGTVLHVDANIGAAVYPDDGKDSDTLISHAISAVDVARDKNDQLVMFNRTMFDLGQRKATLRSELNAAFVEKHFAAWFQPIVNLDGRVVGAEALIRWKHPVLGDIAPTEFIPVLEEAGTIVMIGRWILYQVCSHLRSWEAMLEDRYVSINLSTKEFRNPALVEEIAGILASQGIEARRLKIEITESQLMENLDFVVSQIEGLRGIGVEVLIDDFGSGYSSLGYLKRLPAQTIKIDKMFVDHIVDEEEDRAFLAGVVSMVRSKNRRVLVEGVDNPTQVEILRGIGVDAIQGYFFSPPVPAEEFGRILANNTPLPIRAL